MFEERTEYGVNAFFAMSLTLFMGFGIMEFPREMVRQAGVDGWIASLLGALVMLVPVYLFHVAGNRFPGLTLVQMAERVLGKVLGKALSVIYLLYLFFVLVYSTRVIAGVVDVYILRATPTIAIILAMLLTVAYLADKGIEAVARVSQFLIIFVFPVLLLVVLLGVDHWELRSIMPVLDDFGKVLRGIVPAAGSLLGIGAMGMLTVHLNHPKKAFKAALLALALTAVWKMVKLFAVTSSLGVEQVTATWYPTMRYILSLEVPGFFFEQLGVLFSLAWVCIVFAANAVIYQRVSLGITQVCGFPGNKYKWVVWGQLPVTAAVISLPQNIIDLNEIAPYIWYGGFSVLLLVPGSILLIAVLRAVRGERTDA